VTSEQTKHTNPIYFRPDGYQHSISAIDSLQELQALVVNLPPEEQFSIMIHIQFELFDQLWGENRRGTLGEKIIGNQKTQKNTKSESTHDSSYNGGSNITICFSSINAFERTKRNGALL
jgi:hypothetical protein